MTATQIGPESLHHGEASEAPLGPRAPQEKSRKKDKTVARTVSDQIEADKPPEVAPASAEVEAAGPAIDADWMPGDTLWYWMTSATKPDTLEPAVAVLTRKLGVTGSWQFVRLSRTAMPGVGKPSLTPRAGALTARNREFYKR